MPEWPAFKYVREIRKTCPDFAFPLKTGPKSPKWWADDDPKITEPAESDTSRRGTVDRKESIKATFLCNYVDYYLAASPRNYSRTLLLSRRENYRPDFLI